MTHEQTTTDDRIGALVLKDAAGTYYVLPPDVMEAARVPEERVTEFERLMAEADGDVHGHRSGHQGIGWYDIPIGSDRKVSVYLDGTAASIGAMATLVGKTIQQPRQ